MIYGSEFVVITEELYSASIDGFNSSRPDILSALIYCHRSHHISVGVHLVSMGFLIANC